MPSPQLRLPPVPSTITGEIGQYLTLLVNRLNNEGFISLFSGANPNTSGFTGIPGNLLINIGSASTFTRLWVKGGAEASSSTISWSMVRIAR